MVVPAPPRAGPTLYVVALLFGACAGAPVVDESGDEARFPDDWRPEPGDDDPVGTTGFRLTIATATGPITFEAVTDAGEPVNLVGGLAFDVDGDGADELYLSDGPRRYRLELDTLTLVDPTPWVDGDGAPIAPELYASGYYGGVPVALVTTGSGIRSFDPVAGVVSDPYTLLRTGDDGEDEPFTPASLSMLHLNGPTSGALVAVDDVGGFYVELGSPLHLTNYLPSPDTCSDGTAFTATTVIVAREEDHGGPLPESIVLIGADGEAHALEQARCFADADWITDDDDRPVAPGFAVGADFDGDGFDDIIWGHP